MELKSPFDCILFDLDDTLYSSNVGIAQVCKKNIEKFLAKKCGVSPERSASLRVELFQFYGSSLSGLIALGYDVHPDEYHSYVHWTLPYEWIKPDPQLNELLKSIQQPKIIFTNSDMKHAKRVLERLGIDEQCFNGIICFETLNPHLFQDNSSSSSSSELSPEVILKPSMASMEAAVRFTGGDPHRILFLDDSERNIAAGKALGLHTCLVGKGVKNKEADYLLENISNLRKVIPGIWGEEDEEEHEMVISNKLGSIRPIAQVGA
ncbi:suppressor of disruption of TFIIS-like [Dioscorea cayenensis subsp. rotundata]|uniref:Suppressor of disruption of TFIIS-like n=1 Tax=Dioscorea cayennensis subsp. rotundata TaxID=55577 RepID=A0AB40B130_DIOCR|nr:suppressor of disruption of TFIIS-like [Dioscorea cayenensis subsp. rotundata]